MKLLLDGMWPPAIARQLRERGHDVESIVEWRGLRTSSDAAALAAILADDRVVVTEDADDYRDLAMREFEAGRPYPAFIVTSNRRWPRGNPRTFGRLVNALDALLTSGAAVEGEHWLNPRTEAEGSALGGLVLRCVRRDARCAGDRDGEAQGLDWHWRRGAGAAG